MADEEKTEAEENIPGTDFQRPTKEEYLKQVAEAEAEATKDASDTPEPEPAKEPEPEPEKKEPEVDWEKRYKDQQSYHDKEKNVMDKFIRENSDQLIRDESGNLVFKKPEPEPDAVKFDPPTPAPLKPTPDEWIDDIESAQAKQDAYNAWMIDNKFAERDAVEKNKIERQQRKAAEDAYIQNLEAARTLAAEMFPDAANKESELWVRADEIVRNSPNMSYDPNYELNAFIRAAFELGIPAAKNVNSAKKDDPTPVKPPPKKADDTIVIAGAGGNAGGGEKGFTLKDLLNADPATRRKIMKEDYMKSET